MLRAALKQRTNAFPLCFVTLTKCIPLIAVSAHCWSRDTPLHHSCTEFVQRRSASECSRTPLLFFKDHCTGATLNIRLSWESVNLTKKTPFLVYAKTVHTSGNPETRSGWNMC